MKRGEFMSSYRKVPYDVSIGSVLILSISDTDVNYFCDGDGKYYRLSDAIGTGEGSADRLTRDEIENLKPGLYISDQYPHKRSCDFV